MGPLQCEPSPRGPGSCRAPRSLQEFSAGLNQSSPGLRASALGRSEACATGGAVPGGLTLTLTLILCRSSAQALTNPSPGPRASALRRSEACATGGAVPDGLTLTLTQQLALCRAA